jgi:hypothetical protein
MDITIKKIPEPLHAQLKQHAAANFRSFNQEALFRLQESFDREDQLSAETVAALIDESIASGAPRRLTRAVFDRARPPARRPRKNA